MVKEVMREATFLYAELVKVRGLHLFVLTDLCALALLQWLAGKAQ